MWHTLGNACFGHVSVCTYTNSSLLCIYSTNSIKTFSNVRFEIGGRSSRQFTKFAYNIKLDKKKDEDNLSGYQKLKLRTTVSDPSYMREFITTEMLYAANQPATKASYVR